MKAGVNTIIEKEYFYIEEVSCSYTVQNYIKSVRMTLVLKEVGIETFRKTEYFKSAQEALSFARVWFYLTRCELDKSNPHKEINHDN